MNTTILSIITNFGCHYTCPYCITKNKNIDIPATTVTGLSKLSSYLKQYKSEIVSISGGGDPVWNWHSPINQKYYTNLFYILGKHDCKLELHTSIVYMPKCECFNFPYHQCHRVVYHIHNIEKINKIIKSGNEIVRVVFVVDESFTEDKIEAINQMVKNNPHIDELSFKQMVDNNYKNLFYCHDYLKQGHQKDWYYITQCDYNHYYVNGKVYNTYKDIGRKNNNQ